MNLLVKTLLSVFLLKINSNESLEGLSVIELLLIIINIILVTFRYFEYSI